MKLLNMQTRDKAEILLQADVTILADPETPETQLYLLITLADLETPQIPYYVLTIVS